MDQPLRVADDHAEIREEVAKLCARFPGEYWRELDARRGYPTEFVQALTEAGWLSALIPEELFSTISRNRLSGSMISMRNGPAPMLRRSPRRCDARRT